MAARKLRIETLEARRLFVADLDTIQTSNSDLRNGEMATDMTVPTKIISLDSMGSPLRETAPAAFDIVADRLAGPMLSETAEHNMVARLDYSTHTTNLYISNRQTDGTAWETGVLKIDGMVSSIHCLDDKFVIVVGEYVNQPLPDSDSPFTSWSNSRIFVVDPSSREIVFERLFSGQISISNAVSLPNSLVLQVEPSYSLKFWAEHSPDFSAVGNAEGILATPELIFLYESPDGIQVNREQFVEAFVFYHFDDIVVSYTRQSQTNPNSPLSALRFWDISNNQLREIDAINFAPSTYHYETMHLIGPSPDGTRLLFRRGSLGTQETYNLHEESLVVVEFSKEGANFLLSITSPPNLYTATLISDHQILFWLNGDQPEGQIMDIRDLSRPVLSTPSPPQPMNGTPSNHQIFAWISDNLSEVQIVNNSDVNRPTLAKFNLTHPMYLYDYKVLDSGHLVLLGFTPGTAYVIADTMNGHFGHTSGYDDGPLYGAVVIVDLQQNKITDERLLEPHSRIVQQFPISSLPNHFAFRTITSLPVYRSHETVHVATVDEQGKIVFVDEAKIGSDWTTQTSNGSTLSILHHSYFEVRSWSNIGQKLWRIDYESFDSGVGPDIALTTPVAPQENFRGAIGELLRTTAIPNDIPLDTNGDGSISPIDVLQVINHINRAYSMGETDDLLNITTNAINRFDVDGDSKILPTDVMMMIASLNVVHATYETNDEVPISTEPSEAPRFWDKLATEQKPSRELVVASIETLFGNILETDETSSAGEFWTWFAPLDPLADKLKQQWDRPSANRGS